jgi:hypothetical protein
MHALGLYEIPLGTLAVNQDSYGWSQSFVIVNQVLESVLENV